MTQDELFQYIQKTYHIQPDYPWHDEKIVFRHLDNHKWFVLCMCIPANKINPLQAGFVTIINIKCASILIHSFHQQTGIYPAYHMNKANWLSVDINIVNSETIKMLIDMSFDLTK